MPPFTIEMSMTFSTSRWKINIDIWRENHKLFNFSYWNIYMYGCIAFSISFSPVLFHREVESTCDFCPLLTLFGPPGLKNWEIPIFAFFRTAALFARQTRDEAERKYGRHLGNCGKRDTHQGPIFRGPDLLLSSRPKLLLLLGYPNLNYVTLGPLLLIHGSEYLILKIPRHWRRALLSI